MKATLAFFLLSFILMSETCKRDPNCPDNAHYGITLINRSNVRIRNNIYWNYPDTTIGEYNPAHDGSKGLAPGESFTRGAGMGSCWESVFKSKSKEWIYIFNADTIETISWDVVRRTNRGLLERRLLDFDYLKQHNFEVIYQ